MNNKEMENLNLKQFEKKKKKITSIFLHVHFRPTTQLMSESIQSVSYTANTIRVLCLSDI